MKKLVIVIVALFAVFLFVRTSASVVAESADEDIENEKIASDIDKIARASVRIANYLDGHQVAKFDELDILANRSLRNDLVGAIVTRQEIPIFDRP